MDNSLMNRITEQMLKRHRIISMGQIAELNEVSENPWEPCMVVKYENGREEYIKGQEHINNFINNVISSK